MKIQEIVKVWLIDNGYDGLAGEECGCGIDDLMPCGECDVNHCEAAYKWECEKCKEAKDCIVDCGPNDYGCWRPEKQP
jgi:hypothetical protein